MAEHHVATDGGVRGTIEPLVGCVRVRDLSLPLPGDFRSDRYHQLLLRGGRLELDRRLLASSFGSPGLAELVAQGGAAAFAGVAIA